MSRQVEETRIVHSMMTMVLGKLRANSHKVHWRANTKEELLALLANEMLEFEAELAREPIKPGKLAMEAADIVAILCMIVDNLRTEAD